MDANVWDNAQKTEQDINSELQIFSRLVNLHDLKVGAEVGIAFGGYCEALLKNTQLKKLYGVQECDSAFQESLSQIDRVALRDSVQTRLLSSGERFEFIRESNKFVDRMLNASLDFVFIRARSTYEEVLTELGLWFPKVRDSGILGGNGYDETPFSYINSAIYDFFSRFGCNLNVEAGGIWWVQKKPIGISYIIPAYNSQKTIIESLDSIFAANITPNDEVIVVNDHSTDNTPQILARYSDDHPLTIVDHLTNKGGGAARNTAVEHAKNDLIFCLDSDNVLAPGSVIKLKDFLISAGVHAAAFQELRYFNDDPTFITHRWIFPVGEISFADCLSSGVVPISSGNYLYTKASWRAVGGYPEFARALDAWGFGLRQLACGQRMAVLENSAYLHRYGHESYWVREEKTRAISAIALQILMPFIDQLAPESVEYMLSESGKYKWFENIEKVPLRLKSGQKGRGGVVKINRDFERALSYRLRNLLVSLRTFFRG